MRDSFWEENYSPPGWSIFLLLTCTHCSTRNRWIAACFLQKDGLPKQAVLLSFLNVEPDTVQGCPFGGAVAEFHFQPVTVCAAHGYIVVLIVL